MKSGDQSVDTRRMSAGSADYVQPLDSDDDEDYDVQLQTDQVNQRSAVNDYRYEY